MDAVRWVVLILLFGGLLALWLWSRRQARQNNPPGRAASAGFKIAQKRWLDQRTGLCLVEAEGQSFLLAYTVGGGVSWQALEQKEAGVNRAASINRGFDALLPGAVLSETARR